MAGYVFLTSFKQSQNPKLPVSVMFCVGVKKAQEGEILEAQAGSVRRGE